MRTVEDFTEKEEKRLVRAMTGEYGLTYRKAREIIRKFGDKVTQDGKIDKKEAMKYGRADTLIRDLIILSGLNKVQIDRLTDKFLKTSFRSNLTYTSYLLEGATGITGLVERVPLDIVNEAIHTPLDKVAIQNNATQVKANIRRDVIAGVQQGKTPAQMAKDIKKSLEKNANNALRIAQTESTRVKNSARITAMERAEDRGAEVFKVWDALLDRKTRPTHAELDGDVEPLNKPFKNGLMYPGDESGPPSEVINCRCSLDFITGDGSEIGEEFLEFEEWRQA